MLDKALETETEIFREESGHVFKNHSDQPVQ